MNSPDAPPLQPAEHGLGEGLAARAIELAGVGVWHRVLGQDHVSCNEQMFRILGLAPRPGGLSHAWVRSLQHPEDRGRAEALNDAVVAGGGPLESQLRYVLADGRCVHLLSRRSVLRDASGRPHALLGVTLDVTQRQQAERDLRDARERTAFAVEGAGIGIWEWSARGNTATWDDNMFRLRGLPPRTAALSHEERMALVHPDDREMVARQLEQAGSERAPSNYEFRIVRPDGQVRWLASRSVDLPDAPGGERRRIGANWDVTDRRAAEQARRDVEVALRESQAKSRFLARMSHELRTPLNAVLGFAQLLLAEPPEAGAKDAARRRSLAHIEQAGQHLLTLINDALDLARIESGELALAQAPVPLDALVSQALALVEPQARACDVRLASGPLDLAVLGDETRLRQVLLNLLSNGIKYNRPGGEVRVEAAAVGALVHLRVHDSGRGIAPARLAELFQPFNRLGSEHEAIEGTGIGLAIVKSLVERMGGDVRVSSTPGQGSLFEVVLPRAHASTVAPADPTPPFAPASPGPDTAAAVPAGVPARHVLYIEDNDVNALIVQEVLATAPGYRLTLAADGASGLAAAQREPPELVLLDMQLPDMDGFAVLRQLREQPRTAAVPVVALSANAMPDQVRRGLAAGLADYWTKPLDMAQFLRNMARLLPPRPR